VACFVSPGEFALDGSVRVGLRINEPPEVITVRHEC
jgi:hypothetical protein